MSVNGWRAGGGGGTSLGATLDTDGTLAANSDVKVASQKATKTYADTKAALAGAAFVGDVTTARLGAGSAAAWSTVEKLRVNTPVTASTTASTMLAAGTSAAIPVVIQGAAGHATDFFSVQNSAGLVNTTGIAASNITADSAMITATVAAGLTANGGCMVLNDQDTTNAAIYVNARL